MRLPERLPKLRLLLTMNRLAILFAAVLLSAAAYAQDQKPKQSPILVPS
jgi:hypothetical protein